MTKYMHLRFFVFILISTAFVASCQQRASYKPAWPAITRETKPWTRWWWEGSAVTKEGITAELEAYKKAGLGGVEITPIYGVYGHEKEFISYLSPRWVGMLEYTLKEAERLDLGVDMATGTGWPFGGPWVGADDACKNMDYKVYELKAGESIKEPIRFHQEPFVRSVGMQVYEMQGMYKLEGQPAKGTIKEPLVNPSVKPLDIKQLVEPIAANKNLQALALDQVKFDKQLLPVAIVAYGAAGEKIDLTAKVDAAGKLSWTAPQGNWKVYAVFEGWHGKMVERAAPGGEGNTIDHFSSTALNRYLTTFDTAFKGHDLHTLRAFFNDSYEVDDARGAADWTPDLFQEFKSRRGYDLKDELPALFAKDTPEKNQRVLCDYRETISELLHDRFTKVWHDWAHGQGKIIRNQAHGSPANILDLYAEVDIPEMEGIDVLRIKMASSSANVTGKRLISSESATWLNEHFTSNLWHVKQALDRYMVSGVNHMFYHGTCYSPPGEAWPGWLFYAAVHFNPRNTFWNDFGKLNQYAARCQSFLQNSKADNDVLLYYPIYDRFSTPGNEMVEHFDGVEKQFEGTAFKAGAEELLLQGHTFDYISDKQIGKTTAGKGGVIETGGIAYKTIIVPHAQYVPLETFTKLIALAEEGASIIFYKGLPVSIPGFHDLEQRQQKFAGLVKSLSFTSASGIRLAVKGKGRILEGDNLPALLLAANVGREPLIDQGMQFIRKKNEQGTVYFITNWSEKPLSGWIPLRSSAKTAVLFNPLTDEVGIAASRPVATGTEVHLQLAPGESILVQLTDAKVTADTYHYWKNAGEEQPLNGTWKITFTEGGPELPASIQTDTLSSWTNFNGEAGKNFSGSAVYEINFKKPAGNAEAWILKLGNVCESVSITLNGSPIDTLIGPSYELVIGGSMLKENNQLQLKVSNLMANRIAFMDRTGIFWKRFYNVNFPARKPENRRNGLFDASQWKPMDSGLLGPVKLQPVEKLTP